MNDAFTAEERRVIARWEDHLRCEFTDRDPRATVATMTDGNYVNHVPVMTGGRGRAEMLEFYGTHFIPKMPADTRITPVCRTVGQGRVVDEMIFSFTHDLEMDWMLPGVAPTGRRVEVPLVVVVELDGDRIACERIYWDQASVLAQLGRLDPESQPVAGAETARKVLDPTLPSNTLIRRAGTSRDGGKDFQTTRTPVARDAVAPDGSDVRVLLGLKGGGMAQFELAPGQTSTAVRHRTVEEIWLIVSGRGEMWRRQGDREEIVALEPGICLTIPEGTGFQFRSSASGALAAIGVTMPPWPGEDEATIVDGPWRPTVGPASKRP
jgi:carboxymethylenebutenolidase